MKLTVLAVLMLAVAAVAAAQHPDQKGSKDHPLFTRMPNTYIWRYEEKDFDVYQFRQANGEKLPVEGKKTVIGYAFPAEVKPVPSALQISRNYTNAIAKAGGMMVGPSTQITPTTMKIVQGDKEAWAEIHFESEREFVLTIVEKGEMKQEITAGDLLSSLETAGRVALYINFETGKATLQPDAAAIIDQIVVALRNTPALRVSIEGHTDNVGGAAANQQLSTARANAVMAAIVAKGIAAARLSAAGLGQTKPITDNATEDGRAKNRRVELVKK